MTRSGGGGGGGEKRCSIIRFPDLLTLFAPGGDVLEDHSGLLFVELRSFENLLGEVILVSGDSFQHVDHPRTVDPDPA